MGILLTPLIVYGLLLFLPAIYEGMPREKADVTAGVLYALFLIPSSFYFTFVSAATIDTFGIDKYLPKPLDLPVIILLASLIATLIASLPLLLIRKKREIKRPVLLIFLATFCIDLVLVAIFGWLSAL